MHGKACILLDIPILVRTVLSDYFGESSRTLRSQREESRNLAGEVARVCLVGGEKEGLLALVS